MEIEPIMKSSEARVAGRQLSGDEHHHPAEAPSHFLAWCLCPGSHAPDTVFALLPRWAVRNFLFRGFVYLFRGEKNGGPTAKRPASFDC